MSNVDIVIRPTTTEDLKLIQAVLEDAFDTSEEWLLVQALLKDQTAHPLVSLLAFVGDKAVGYILSTRVYLDRAQSPLMHILAPMAVVRPRQGQGIGGALIKRTFEELQKMESELVVVLGHMEYYPRFGFIPDAAGLGLKPPHAIPSQYANAWMVKSLISSGSSLPQGTIQCCNELNKKKYWEA